MKIKHVSIWLLALAVGVALGAGCADPPPETTGLTGDSNGNMEGQGSGNGSSNSTTDTGTDGVLVSNSTSSNGTSNDSTSGTGGTSNTTNPSNDTGGTSNSTSPASNGTSNNTTSTSNGTSGTSNGTTAEEFECDPDPEEACDGLDNNCDGQVDEGCSCGQLSEQPCYGGPPETINIGICRQGVQRCEVEFFGECEGAVMPQTELCDGLDNDCDGEIDETFDAGTPCSMGSGSCASQGVQICNDAGDGVTCTAVEVEPGDELCDSLDNDCDGSVDEDFTLLGEPCSVGLGACANTGVEVCSPDGIGTVCSVEPLAPTNELCDGIDNNCNMSIDEAFPELGQPCTVGEGVCARNGTWICADDDRGVVCDATAGQPEGPEVCDMLDNDCNGQVDELPECNNRPPEVVCPPEVDVSTLDTATLTAQASDPDGNPMTYRWELISAPMGSGSAPTPTNQLTTSLWMDIAGDFRLRFTATDTNDTSASCETLVHSVPSEQFRVELLWNIGAPSDDS
ncbi:MAG: MopE-related protein, partial [Myxococcota bacterium]